MKQIDRCPFAHRQMMHGVSDSQFAGCHQTKCITFSTYNVACVTIIIRNCVGMHQRETLLTTEEKKMKRKQTVEHEMNANRTTTILAVLHT